MSSLRETTPAPAQGSLRDVPLSELLGALTGSVKRLAKTEVELAKAEVRADVQASLGMAKRFGAAAVCGILGIEMLLVAGAFALATVLPAWAAALVVAAPFLVAAAVLASLGWSRRLRKPMEVTRSSLKEDVRWAKDRLA
jgi:hypothetical protein